MNQSIAVEFFEQLTKFSKAVLASLKLPEKSPWVGGAGAFRGAILHYTANDSLEGTLRWFCHEPFQAKASAHVVVSPRRETWAEKFLTGLPLVAALPVTVVQTVPADRVAWHATWASAWSYGIENVNAGELRRGEDGGVYHWPPLKPGMPEWTTPWRGARPVVAAAGRLWDSFPTAQLAADIQLLRYVNALHYGMMGPEWILGHEQVQGAQTPGSRGSQKRDPGPTFPLHFIREHVFRDDPVALAEGLAAYSANVAGWQETQRQAWLSLVRREDFPAWVEGRLEHDAQVFLKVALKVLGYDSDPAAVRLDARDTASIRVFQTMMGLTVDGVAGPKTRAALFERLKDRGYIL